MIYIDPEIRIKHGIREGAVYYLSIAEIANGASHYYVVLNSDFGSGLAVLVMATSQIEKKQNFIESRNLPKSTLVVVDSTEYKHFTKQTAFNCNEVHPRTLEYLIQKLADGDLKTFLDDICPVTLEKLRSGVKASPLIEENIKQMF